MLTNLKSVILPVPSLNEKYDTPLDAIDDCAVNDRFTRVENIFHGAEALCFFSCEMVSNSSSFYYKFKILTDMKSHFEDLQIFSKFYGSIYVTEVNLLLE